MLELCISGQALSMLRRSALAQTMKAFIGRLMCSPPSLATPPDTPPELPFDLEPATDDLKDLSGRNPRPAEAETTEAGPRDITILRMNGLDA